MARKVTGLSSQVAFVTPIMILNQFSVLDNDPVPRRFDQSRDPYYIGNGDHPSASLVPKILTGSDNYNAWRRSMIVALSARNKIQFVNGKLQQPDEDHDIWNRCNDLYCPLPVCNCGAMKIVQEYQEEDKVMEFLIGLNESYGAVRSQILMQDPLPAVNKAYASVIQEERQRSITAIPNTVADSDKNASDSSGVTADQFSGNATFNRSKVTCHHCGMLGHIMAKCYKLHGYPPGHKFYGKNPSKVAYHINRTPSPNLQHKTPYEILHGQPPNYEHLKAFGYLAYVSTLNSSRTKFSPRVVPCVFLGYPHGMRAYKFLDLNTNRIFCSRDAIFHEYLFPFVQSARIPDSHHNFLSDFSNADMPSDVTHSKNTIIPPDVTNTSSDVTHNSASRTPIIHDSAASQVASRTIPTRTHHKPSYLTDYHCFLTKFSAGVFSQDQDLNQTFFFQARGNPVWDSAMDNEIVALEANNTWTIVSLPLHHHVIGCKWVYKIKFNADGSVEKFKARLVAKGYDQQEGVDYFETFAPVAKLVTVKLILALAAVNGWILHELDVNNAFLHGDLHEDVYMTIPQGYSPKGELPPNAVCKLNKSLYGLKQASRQWFEKFSTTLEHEGFHHSATDHSLFIKYFGDKFILLLVYVDDVILVSNHAQELEALKVRLNNKFKLKDLGELRYFLGLEIAGSKEGIFVSQRGYALQLLEDLGYLGSKPVSTPMESNLKLSQDSKEGLVDPTLYRKMVGKLQYLCRIVGGIILNIFSFPFALISIIGEGSPCK
uniref:Polyprotein n=1 Tax=Cannabis sativa TaxID=3483 RepID=A0A803QH13_CANSA